MPKSKNIKILITAAYKNEIAPLCKMGRKYLVIKNDIAYLSAGIGPVAASFGLTHFLEDYRPQMIITLGTAGIINPKFKIGDVAVAKSVSAISDSKHVYPPIKSTTLHISTNPAKIVKKLDSLKKASVYCPQEITRSEDLCQELKKNKYDIENLEAYAFHFVAKKFKIPTISLFGLTNGVGPKAHQEWKMNEEKLCKRLANTLKTLME